MSMAKQLEALQKSAAHMRAHAESLEKYAFDPMSLVEPAIHWGAPLVAGEVGMVGLKRFGRKQAPAMLRGGIDLGRENKKTSPYISDFLQTSLGKGSTAPLSKGEEIGQFMREKGMGDDRSNRFLERLSGINGARRKRVERDHVLRGELDKMPGDPVGDALQKMLQGKGKTLMHKTLVRTGVESDAKRHIGHDLAQLPYVLPGAYAGDTRFALRPIMRRVEGTRIGDFANKLDQRIQQTPAAPTINRIKRYIDE